ncbi:MBL fold metallo-hydrolase RNA specificity domain-containing protein [Desulfitibacter alkalitolerans]|uniref:MBL fold metallo-hydrolase RNA specificity domain-containing protein n=1 Tax=Desulfitibacter alkalitolerans TaxID=264641 RepID=UPI000A76D011|nr:MBL fold metallo-hydrolase [Desulfitibacter alkalitolerans]
MMKIIFCGGAETVTGSCYLVKTDTGESLLVDCGLFQGSKAIKERNYGDFPFEPNEIDWVLLTHAHIDHSGRIPKLYKKGYRGPIITTKITKELCAVMLPDSAYIQEMEVERKNRKNLRAGKPLLEPIYTVSDAEECIKLFEGKGYDEIIKLNDNVSLRFTDAGHILGSSIIEIWIKGTDGVKKVTFTGDLGNYDKPLVDDPEILEGTDFLVIESTYGSRNHDEEDEAARIEKLSEVIESTFKRGGNVVIPAFAVERTQDLIFDLNKLIQEGRINPENIFVDSPLAIAITEIFCKNADSFDEAAQDFSRETGRCPLTFKNLRFTRTAEESKTINNIKSGAIIISASGMCDAGRIKHHLKHNLWRANSTILFIGYQAEGTLGRTILNGAKKVRIHGEEITVNARIESIKGYSSHSDQGDILKWINSITHKPELIFLVHGEVGESSTLKTLIEENYQIETHIPYYLEEYSLTKRAKPVLLHDLSRKTAAELQEELEDLLSQLQQVGERLILEEEYHKADELFKELKKKLT